MQLQTTRFGTIQVDEERVISFPRGLLGFGEQTRFILFPAAKSGAFFWLQSLRDPELAFVVTDPTLFIKEYEVPLYDDTRQALELQDPGTVQIMVICNKVGAMLTGNLAGPLVINSANRLARQVVLADTLWNAREPLIELKIKPAPLAKSA